MVMAVACTRTSASVDPDPAPHAGASPVAATEPPALAPWMRPSFDPSVRRSYAWRYAVDVHDEEGSVAEASGTLRCRSDGPTRLVLDDGEVAQVSCQSCTLERDEGDEQFEPALDDCLVGTSRGLWIVEEPPADAARARELVATPPYLAASPEARAERWSAEDDGMEHELSLEIAAVPQDVLGRPTTSWCRTDADTLMYGSSLTRCFAPEHGLVSVAIEGRSGPSTESYVLTEVSPAPTR